MALGLVKPCLGFPWLYMMEAQLKPTWAKEAGGTFLGSGSKKAKASFATGWMQELSDVVWSLVIRSWTWLGLPLPVVSSSCLLPCVRGMKA